MRARTLAGWRAATVFLLISYAGRAVAQSAESPYASACVVLGLGAGAMHVDLPDAWAIGANFGTRPRVQFDLGVAARPWLECGAQLGFTFLAQSDSLNAAIAAAGLEGPAVRTHVQATADVRARWLRGDSRWAPYLRAGAGIAVLYVEKIGTFGGSTTNPAWDAGVGLDFAAPHHILLRAEGLYLGQAADTGTAHNAAFSVAVFYTLSGAQLHPEH